MACQPQTLHEAIEREERIIQLSKEYAHHTAAAQPHLDRIKTIKAELRDLLDYGAYSAEGVRISIEHTRTFNTAAFIKAFPQHAYPAFYKPAVNTTVVRDTLPPAVYQHYQVEGEKKIIIT